jgi:hypothetical protein
MKIYCFDLDGTLCTNTNGDYKNANPFLDRIKKLNELHNDGNKIIIDTARGSTTGIDWYELTEYQLRTWGVNFDELIVGRKVHADVFIDDKGINDNIFFNE